MTGSRLHAYAALVACLMAGPAARAQFAVIDVSAVNQLIEQARTLEAQLATARDHLQQARSEFNSMTGSRGMQNLLAGVQRNYLPSDWVGLQQAMTGGGPGSSGVLAAAIAGTVRASAILSPAQLAELPPDVQQQIGTARLLAALHQNLARAALATTSRRFSGLQQLIQALPSATDQKAVLELQARIGAESVMLQNEQTKLQTLFQVALAEEQASRQQMREQVLMDHGVFANRFQPLAR